MAGEKHCEERRRLCLNFVPHGKSIHTREKNLRNENVNPSKKNRMLDGHGSVGRTIQLDALHREQCGLQGWEEIGDGINEEHSHGAASLERSLAGGYCWPRRGGSALASRSLSL